MTETTRPTPGGLLDDERRVLGNIQRAIGFANAEKGFHEEGDALREIEEPDEQEERSLRTYYGEKLLLIVSEVTEAHDEIRKGIPVDETYYPSRPHFDEQGSLWNGYSEAPYKPEGVPSEIADVVIRCFDFADEAGFDLAEIIDEKLRYNATRAFKHGKKF